MVWPLVLLFVVSLVVVMAMVPQAPGVKPQSMDPGNLPLAEPGAVIPIVFGTYIIQSPNIVWYGDLSQKAIKTKSGK